MIVLGLLFILLVALAGTWFYLALTDLAGGGPANDLTAFGVTVGLSPAALLLTGFGLAVALGIGLYLIKAGMSAGARRRRERKELERTAADNRKAAEAAAAERLRTARSQTPERASTTGEAPTAGDRPTGTPTGGSGPDRRSITEPVRDGDSRWTPGDGRRDG